MFIIFQNTKDKKLITYSSILKQQYYCKQSAVSAAPSAACLWCWDFCNHSKNEWNHLSIKVMLNWRTRGGSGAAYGQLRPPLVTVSLPGCLSAALMTPSIQRGGMERAQLPVQPTAVENRSIERLWQHISFQSVLNNCTLSSGFVLCLVSGGGSVKLNRVSKGHFCIPVYWDCFTAFAGFYFFSNPICFWAG